LKLTIDTNSIFSSLKAACPVTLTPRAQAQVAQAKATPYARAAAAGAKVAGLGIVAVAQLVVEAAKQARQDYTPDYDNVYPVDAEKLSF
jgi:predicted outer membrane protein